MRISARWVKGLEVGQLGAEIERLGRAVDALLPGPDGAAGTALGPAPAGDADGGAAAGGSGRQQ